MWWLGGFIYNDSKQIVMLYPICSFGPLFYKKMYEYIFASQKTALKYLTILFQNN